MLQVLGYLGVLFLGIILGHVLAIVYAHETLTRSGKIYKELVLRGDAAMAILSKLKEEIAQLQGDGRKRVVLAEDLSSIRKAAGMPETFKVQEAQRGPKIVRG